MPAVDVFGAQAGGLALRQPEFRKKGSQIDSFLSGFGRSDNLSLLRTRKGPPLAAFWTTRK
eukprot:3530722-Pleurochrysis_carterae.AAC.1